jgi:site-specific DNA-cytosine methylase
LSMQKHYKILLGGSPCTYWSISQSSDKRETEASGIGWELFKNFLYARDKFKPDYFLYENNKSMAKPIRNQIDIEFNRTYAENTNWELITSVEENKGHTKRWLWINKTTGKTEHITRILINSALVSAQNRQRYYWTNIPNVQQPSDRGILLKDILEKGGKTGLYACPINTTENGKAQCLRASCYKDGIRNLIANNVDKKTCVAEPIRVGSLPRPNGELSTSQGMRIYSVDGKAVTQSAQGGGLGAKTGLYAVPVDDLTPFVQKKIKSIVNKYGYLPEKFNPYNAAEITDKAPTLTAQCASQTKSSTVMVVERWDGKTYPVYEVKNGLIEIKGKTYPIRLQDGFYIIRKLTVNECRRLQTIPDWCKMPCSASQNYKMLGNGWTVEVIKHILSYIPDIQSCTVEVLSMYDGMSCGQIALTELGCKIERYVSYEIDKYCIQTTQMNFPKTEQRGDAFQLRNTKWCF